MPTKIRSIINKFAYAFLAFQGKKSALTWSILLSIPLQAGVVIHFFLISRALGLEVPLHAFFLIIPLATIVMLIPASVNGIGVRESVFIIFLAAFGVSSAEAIAFSWISYGIVIVTGLLGGVVYITRKENVAEHVEATTQPVEQNPS